MTIILGHMWIIEHNPEIDWCTGKVSMTRCPAVCRPDATSDGTSQLIPCLADNSAGPPRVKSCGKVHIKEVLEGQPESPEAEPLPGFACLDLDDMS